jgi:hypothetical protein
LYLVIHMLLNLLFGGLLFAGFGLLCYWLLHTPKAKAQAQVGAIKDDQAKVQSDVQKVESSINNMEKKL